MRQRCTNHTSAFVLAYTQVESSPREVSGKLRGWTLHRKQHDSPPPAQISSPKAPFEFYFEWPEVQQQQDDSKTVQCEGQPTGSSRGGDISRTSKYVCFFPAGSLKIIIIQWKGKKTKTFQNKKKSARTGVSTECCRINPRKAGVVS